MQIKFNITPDDIRAYASYMYSTSPTLRKYRIKTLGVAVAVLVVMYFVLVRDKDIYSTGFFAVVGVLSLILATFWMRRGYLRNVVRMYKEKENPVTHSLLWAREAKVGRVPTCPALRGIQKKYDREKPDNPVTHSLLWAREM